MALSNSGFADRASAAILRVRRTYEKVLAQFAILITFVMMAQGCFLRASDFSISIDGVEKGIHRSQFGLYPDNGHITLEVKGINDGDPFFTDQEFS